MSGSEHVQVAKVLVANRSGSEQEGRESTINRCHSPSTHTLVARSHSAILHICSISLRCDPSWVFNGETKCR